MGGDHGRQNCRHAAARQRLAGHLESVYELANFFPQGPFILASILRCPMVLIFALQQSDKLHIHCESFAVPRFTTDVELTVVLHDVDMMGVL